MIPTVGRSVHYTNPEDGDGRFEAETHHAVITSATLHGPVMHGNHDEGAACSEKCYDVTLVVFSRTGLYFLTDPVQFHPEPQHGAWMWPPRVT